jgi:hypothetical protein
VYTVGDRRLLTYFQAKVELSDIINIFLINPSAGNDSPKISLKTKKTFPIARIT